MKRTRLWMVRHGPTHEKAMVGWRDVPADLSDLAAIERLRAALPEAPLRVSSDLSRTMATAAVLPSGDTLPPDPALRELNFGDWDGRTATEISQSDGDYARAFWETPGDLSPPNGESWNAFQSRIDGAIDGLIAAHTGRDLLVVAHFGVITATLRRAASIPAKSALAFRIDPLSLTVIDHFDAANWGIDRVNHRP